MSVDVQEALSAAAADELARRRLIDFARLLYPQFESPPHIEYIAGLLEELEAGRVRRLCVSVPVRSGKSVLCSQIFPAWYVGRHPRESIILASHSESLAVLHSRQAKRLVQDDRYPFSDVKMSADSASVQRWNVTDGGGLYAIGVGGSITGRGSHVLIVDDALHDGLSAAERESAWAWLTEVAVPRMEPGARIIVVAARFADDDIPGRLAESADAKEWKFVSLPAIAGENDPMGRVPGAALWPTRFSIEELEERRQMMGSAAFEAQFQQNPTPAGGVMFKPEWFEHRFDVVPLIRTEWRDVALGAFAATTQVIESSPLVIQAIDSAWKDGPSNDRSCIATLASDLKDIYVTDVLLGRWLFTDLYRIVNEIFRKHNPSRLFVEEAASGYAIVNQLRAETHVPVIGVTPGRESKAGRAESVTAYFEAGRVKFPRHASWMQDVLQEFLRFPVSARGDDAVDAICLGVRMMISEINRIMAAEELSKKTRDFMAR